MTTMAEEARLRLERARQGAARFPREIVEHVVDLRFRQVRGDGTYQAKDGDFCACTLGHLLAQAGLLDKEMPGSYEAAMRYCHAHGIPVFRDENVPARLGREFSDEMEAIVKEFEAITDLNDEGELLYKAARRRILLGEKG